MPVHQPGKYELLVRIPETIDELSDEDKYPDFVIYMSKDQLRKVGREPGMFKLNVWAKKNPLHIRKGPQLKQGPQQTL